VAESRRIKQFLRPDAVHATCDVPAFSLAAFIGIDLGQAQSVTMDDIGLAVDLSFDSHSIRIGDEYYTLSLASVRVILEKDNADIVAGSKYSHELSEGEIVAEASDMQTSGREHSYGGKAEAGLLKGIAGKLSFRGKRSGAKEKKASTKVKHRINFVSPGGQDSWRVGGPDGDPRLDTKDLRGKVINSVWGEERRLLCQLEAIDPNQPVTGRLRIQANPEDFRLRGKARQAVAKDMVVDGVEKNQGKLVESIESTEKQLRERVAAMALLKDVRLPDRKTPDEGMLDLAARSFAYIPDIEEPGA
jgi:hypothetical protein